MIIIKECNENSNLYLVKLYHKWFSCDPMLLTIGDVLTCHSKSSHKILSIKSFPSKLNINSYDLKIKKFVYLELDGDLLHVDNVLSLKRN